MNKISKVIKSILIILATIIYAFFNLKCNTVYYAKNMPRGEGQEPEIIMLIENMNWVDTPYIEYIEYKSRGKNAIINSHTQEVFTISTIDGWECIYIS